MSYILILFVSLHTGSIHVEHVEFVDQRACEKALTVIMDKHKETKSGNTNGRQIMGVCVHKGSVF